MGQATSLRLAEAGAATVVADIAADKAKETADLIAKRTPGAQAVPLAVDVADPASVRALGDALTRALRGRRHLGEHGLAELERRHRRLPGRDVAAGTGGQPGRFLLHRPRGGPQDAAGRPRGVIILVTSGSAHRGRARRYQYVAAKHGTLGLVKSLALELGPAGIRVIAIAPAATDTPGFRVAPTRFGGADAEQAKRLLDDTVAKMALGRLGQADDIARAAVFAASDMAGFITGSTIHVDGGVDAS